MSKRLQVIVDEGSYERYRRRAEKEDLSLSEWVRRALEDEMEREPGIDPESRLEALDRALECEHPSGDIDEMLDEVEQGRDLH